MRMFILLVVAVLATGCDNITERALKDMESKLVATTPEKAKNLIDEVTGLLGLEGDESLSPEQRARAEALRNQRLAEGMDMGLNALGEGVSAVVSGAKEVFNEAKEEAAEFLGVDVKDMTPKKGVRWLSGVDDPRYKEFIRCRDATTDEEKEGCP